MKTASEINASCPIMVDQDTRLDNTIALPGNTFQYNYTLMHFAPINNSDIDLELELEKFRKVFENQILINVKTNPDLKFFRDNEVTMNYYYKDKKGNFITKIIITPDQYKE